MALDFIEGIVGRRRRALDFSIPVKSTSSRRDKRRDSGIIDQGQGSDRQAIK